MYTQTIKAKRTPLHIRVNPSPYHYLSIKSNPCQYRSKPIAFEGADACHVEKFGGFVHLRAFASQSASKLNV